MVDDLDDPADDPADGPGRAAAADVADTAATDLRTIPAVLERAAARFGEREGLVDGDRRLTFADLAAAADDAARAYVASGIEPGDRIAIWAPNMGDWVVAALGALRAGAVVATVNSRVKGGEAAPVPGTAGAPPTPVWWHIRQSERPVRVCGIVG